VPRHYPAPFPFLLGALVGVLLAWALLWALLEWGWLLMPPPPCGPEVWG